ncbi:M48 family metalloprotease [Vitiosangium sp. GDMCC 1.1324]|uniref:M48 family metalloprotease n=1 Tax=Vitiosangium sp. (strain GDMCC 1.1324) TaxID=2138576 RepID=UPI000D3B34DD|nr:M48 family metalloprotease [Vitiosangium sp. GDMCC 1.1324]PTL79889.1 peptidase M48 [Vitiosangium sp. GDMCC 1.1324]
MRGKTLLASIVTLTFMGGFVFTTFAAISIASRGAGAATFLLAIAVTVGWAFLSWLLSPFLMDLAQRWLYSARNMSLDELRNERPAVADFVERVCQKHGIQAPRLKFIDDQTPQAYCYGSHGNNARLVTTRGLMHYLDDEELKAVYAHELGHIIHRDFIVMTVAATLLNILWTIYVVAKNIRGKNNSRPAMPLALVALLFWWVSQYLLMYLSRTREYYADEFAAAETGNPNALSMALVKVAYGITRQEKTDFTEKFLGGTRAMGIADPKSAASAGFAFQVAQGSPSTPTPALAHAQAGSSVAAPLPKEGAAPLRAAVSLEGVQRIEKVMLFDLYNPWAAVSEISSTHPLTGKRIRALGEQASALGQRPLMSFDKVDLYGQALDMQRMYGTFFLELAIYFAPQLLAALFIMSGLVSMAVGQVGVGGALLVLTLFGIGLGMTLKGFYSFGATGEAQATSVLELMSDPYASPLKGRPVTLQGTVVGRADAGNKLGEDMTLEDPKGGLILLNYESPFGPLGNWWFAARRVGKLAQQRVQVVGWFRRGVSQQVDLKQVRTEDGEEISSWTGLWNRVLGVLVLGAGLVFALFVLR